MRMCLVTGDKASDVKSKTNEAYYIWLEGADKLQRQQKSK